MEENDSWFQVEGEWYPAPFCEDCGQKSPDMFMLKNRLWKQIGNGEGRLCLKCCNARSVKIRGKALTIHDFMKGIPVNDSIFCKHRYATDPVFRHRTDVIKRLLEAAIKEGEWSVFFRALIS